MILLKVRQGLWAAHFFCTCNTRTRRRLHGENVSECCGNRTAVFSRWEECSVSAGCVEECQADHRQSFFYCQLSKINSCKQGLVLILKVLYPAWAHRSYAKSLKLPGEDFSVCSQPFHSSICADAVCNDGLFSSVLGKIQEIFTITFFIHCKFLAN